MNYDTHLSVGEILRFISVITEKEVSMDLFSKAETLYETVWQLLIRYFDMPTGPFKPAYVYVLMNRVVEELGLPQPIVFEDFLEPIEKKKWTFILSRIIQFIESRENFAGARQIYTKVVQSKKTYTELLEDKSQLNETVAIRRAETKAKQDVVEQLETQLNEALTLDEAAASEFSSLDNVRVKLNDSIAKRTEHIVVLDKENDALGTELEYLQKEVSQDVSSLPESIGMMKDRLNQIERDIHALFEERTSLIEQDAVFERCESMLTQLRSTVDQIHALSRKNDEIHRQDKALQSEKHKVVEVLDLYNGEKDQLSRRVADIENDIRRKRLVLANKKKALQAKKKNAFKESESIRLDTMQERKELRNLEEKIRVLQHRLDRLKEELKKLDQRLPLADKFLRQLNDLYDDLSNDR